MKRIHDAGYYGLVLLALALPFDLRYQPLLKQGLFTITNLGVVLYAVAALALVTVGPPVLIFVRHVVTRTPDPTNYAYQRRVPILLYAALFLSCTISGSLGGHQGPTAMWILNLLAGGLVWLAIPLWLADNTEVKVKRIVAALVIGVIIAALVGFVEMLWGPAFDKNLVGFKTGATKMGPYLRLSGTFSHANVAAMWLGVTLAFTVVGLAGALAQRPRRWSIVAAWLIASDVLLGALLLTYSRGGLLGLAVSAVLMGTATRCSWDIPGRLRHWKLALGLTAALAAVIGAFALSSSPVEALRFSGLSDRDWYGMSYRSDLPATLEAGHTVAVRATVRNGSAVTWRASGPEACRLSYHWLYSTRQMEELEGIRTVLRSDVRPGGSQTVLADVRPPSVPGSYFLVWDMVLGNGTWFSLRSAHYTVLPVRVTDRSRDPPGRTAVRLPNPGEPTELPTAPPPDRARIWGAALRMIEAHPLFGTGPEGVWLNFEAFARTPWSIYGAHAPGHAHSLSLEIAADFGLVGAGLLLAWFLAAWWPVVLGVWRGRMLGVWQVALVGAAGMLVGNGLVDYTLQSLGLFTLFWLLSGLATVMP
jgi:hypothetical protein